MPIYQEGLKQILKSYGFEQSKTELETEFCIKKHVIPKMYKLLLKFEAQEEWGNNVGATAQV